MPIRCRFDANVDPQCRFNEPLSSFAVVTVGFEIGWLGGSVQPFYEWREISNHPLIPLIVVSAVNIVLAVNGT